MVERPAVNRVVAGSSPARGANRIHLEESRHPRVAALFGSGGSGPAEAPGQGRGGCRASLLNPAQAPAGPGMARPELCETRRVSASNRDSDQPESRPSRNPSYPGPQPQGLKPWALAALCSVPFVMVLGNSMLIPVFPLIERTLGITPFQVGLLITAFSLPAGLLIPVAGALSDRFGRKVIMVPALVLYGTGGLLAGAAGLLLENPYPFLLGARVVQGVGAGGKYQLAMTLTGDLLPRGERARALGLLETSNGIGKVVSPLLGSLLGV